AAAGVGILGGVLLAAAQLIPLAMAASQSPRAGMRNDGLWSLHPLASLELFVPKVFGSSFDADISELPWLAAMNGDRDPLLYTLYMGIGALALSIAGARHDRGWSRFWVWTAVAGFIAALGEFSFPYRTLQSVVPVVESFRFPMKYLSVCALAAGALA